MNKKKAIIASVCTLSTFAIVGGIVALSGNTADRLLALDNAPMDGYNIILNKDVNNPLIAGESLLGYKVKTKERGNDILFDFNGVASDAEETLVSLNANGSIENKPNEELLYKNKISGIKSIKIDYVSDAKVELKFGWSKLSSNPKDMISIDSGVQTEVLGGPSYFRINARSATEIKSIEINYSCEAGLDYNADIDKFEIFNNNAIVGVHKDDISSDQTKLVFPKYFANKLMKQVQGGGSGFFPSQITKTYIPDSYTRVPPSIFRGTVYFEGTKPGDFYGVSAEEKVNYNDFLAKQ